jgi:transcriptional regulator GlxA family with amidase domain
MQIQALIFDGFDELDVIGVYEPLRMSGLDVKLMSLEQQDIVESFHGIKISPDGLVDKQNKPDLLIVPGGGWVARANRGAWAEAQKGKVLELLKYFHECGVILASVCTGSMLLAKAGLLVGRAATTHHKATKELEEYGARIKSGRVIDDGNIITAGGVTSSIDLGLWLVERFISPETAKEVSNRLEFERQN